MAQALEIGRKAEKFTADAFAKPFNITTRWQNALGESKLGREYGIVTVSGKDLGELLVANGLARIHGANVGGIGKDHVDRLHKLEDHAMAMHIGAWGIVTPAPT